MVFKKILISLVILGVSTLFANGFEIDYTTPWVGKVAGSAKISNTTSSPWFLDGIRANVNSAVNPPASAFNPLSGIVTVNDGNDEPNTNRWEFKISSNANNNNFAGYDGERDFTINPDPLLPWDDDTTKWKPFNEQWLVKVGSFGTKKSFFDIDSLSLDSLGVLVTKDFFHDASIYVPDTLLGERGGPASGGMLNTWYDQEADSALWQVQMCEADVFKQNGVWSFFNPFVMGEQHSSWGAGPMYAMSLAMITEYFHIDWVLMESSATNESGAGLEEAANITDYNTGEGSTPSGKSLYIASNGAVSMGPNHWEESSYKDVIWGGYPKYFPEDRTYVSSPKYSTTPGTSDCVGNSPQIANSELINATYYWYMYELLYNSTEFYADKAFRDAADREIAAKLFLAMWNGGRNSVDPFLANLMSTHITKPELTSADLGNTYVDLIYRAIRPIQDGSRNSEVIGGDKKVYDSKISRENVEWLYFGDNASPAAGTLGDGGILHHFSLSSDERVAIWTKLMAAFDLLSAKSSYSSEDGISFRYDWLALMRVVKGDIDLAFPTPTNSDFVTWVDLRSQSSVIEDNGGPKVEKDYPFLVQEGKGFADNKITHGFKLTDETYLDIDSLPTVEWTADSNWGKWKAATKISGTTLEAHYEVQLSEDEANEAAGGVGQKITAWVRGYDRNYNAVIDTFSIFWEIPNEPNLDSSIAIDSDGDGMADKLQIHLTKSTADDADELSSVTNLEWSWPTGSTFVKSTEAPDATGLITITDESITNGAGTGAVTFESTSRDDFSADILDRVGPAISTATIDAVNKDILLLSATEDIVGDGNSYLEFSTDKTAAVAETSESFTIFSKDSIAVELSSSLIVDNGYRWVRFVDQDGVEDLVGNTPHKESQWVKITGGAETSISSKLVDTTGNGYGDRISTTLNLGSAEDRFTGDDVSAISFSWKGEVDIDTTFTKDELEIIEEGMLALAYEFKTGYGSGKINLESNSKDAISGTVVDKVGAALTGEAKYSKEDDARAFDTLLLIVTEELNISVNGENKPYLEFSTARDASFTIVECNSFEFIATDQVVALMPKGAIEDNDYSWVRLSDENGVIDLKDNFPHTSSRPVYISSGKFSYINLQSAYYIDETEIANGLIDKLVLEFDVDLERFDCAETIKSGLVLNADRTLTVSEVLIAGKTATVAIVDATEIANTAITEGDSISIPLSFVLADNDTTFKFSVLDSFELEDRVAPVLVETSHYKPTEVNEDGENLIIKDDLTLKFSEVVEMNGAGYPFEFYDLSEIKDGITLEVVEAINAEDVSTVTCKVIEENIYLPEAGDSIRVLANQGVKDLSGNEQDRNTKFVELTVGAYTYKWNVFVYPNPYSMQKADEYRSTLEEMGIIADDASRQNVAILIKSKGPRRVVGTVDANIVILDNLGNVMGKSTGDDFIDASQIGGKACLIALENKNGKTLASGSYLGIMRLKVITDGKPSPQQEHKFAIGVQK
jgi:hypothetical protein